MQVWARRRAGNHPLARPGALPRAAAAAGRRRARARAAHDQRLRRRARHRHRRGADDVPVRRAGISVLGTPVDAPSEFNVTEIEELTQQPIGAAFLITQMVVSLGSAVLDVLLGEYIEGESSARQVELDILSGNLLLQNLDVRSGAAR